MTTLLVDLLGQDAPHIHVMRETPLFGNLLRCLQVDTSTTVIAPAMTALTMFLPHIPVSSGGYLPALFNIYTRMLFWEKQRNPDAKQDSDDGQADTNKTEENVPWEQLTYSGDASDESLPDILHYFTFLYGLYPMNFMSYIRKPSKWLKERKIAAGPYHVEVEAHEIQYRSDPFRAQHLLHPHFLSHTIDSEITDAERWRQHAASDVATFCMTLIQPLAEDSTSPATPNLSGPPHQDFSRTFELRRIDRGLLTRSSSHETFHTHRSHEAAKDGITSNPTSGLSSRHMSAVISPDGTGEFSQLARLPSRNSQSASSTQDVQSPCTTADARPDSAGMTDAVSSLNDMLNSQQSIRSNLRHSIKNDSSTTLSSLADTSHHANANVDTYLASLPQQQPPRSPSLRPTTTQSESATIASLQRDVTLLKNSLSFERYLKQQHFAHIGKLRRQGIREAQAEAETQNLVNDNRKLKLDLKKEREMVMKVRKEADLSRAQSRKWEADVTAKLRIIKEEQKRWLAERELMKTELEMLKGDNEGLKQLIIQSEEREHQTSRRLQGIEIELENLKRLEAEKDKLKQRLRKFLQGEKGEEEKAAERERQESKIGLLEMQLEVRDRELEEIRLASTEEIESLKSKFQSVPQIARREATTKVQQMIDSALDASRKRFDNAQRLQSKLRDRIAALEAENMALKEQEGRDTLKTMRSEGFTSDPLSPTRQPRRAINMNPLDPYKSGNALGGDGEGGERPTVSTTQSTPALPYRVPNFDAHSLSIAGGGGRVLSNAAPIKHRAPTTPTPSRAFGRGQSVDAATARSEGREGTTSERGGDSRERAKSPKGKAGERSGLLFGRGRSLYDSLF